MEFTKDGGVGIVEDVEGWGHCCGLGTGAREDGGGKIRVRVANKRALNYHAHGRGVGFNYEFLGESHY